jgi:putative glutamine amidotransferase
MKARHTRPLIAIFRNSPEASGAREHPGYFDVVQAVGGLPLLLAASARAAEIHHCLERAHGAILDGGPDLDASKKSSPAAMLIQHVMDRRLPLLAIGQGMHQLNAAAGGTLYPPFTEDQDGALAHSKPRHAVLLEPGTRIEEIYERDEICVDNDHRQTVRRAGEGLRVSGLAPDGVIEAIEAIEPSWFCLGIQWHPKTEGPAAPDLRLFESLLAACLRTPIRFPLPARGAPLAV